MRTQYCFFVYKMIMGHTLRCVYTFVLYVMWRLTYWISVISHREMNQHYTSIYTHYIKGFFEVSQGNKHNTDVNRDFCPSFRDLFLFLPNNIKQCVVLECSLWPTCEGWWSQPHGQPPLPSGNSEGISPLAVEVADHLFLMIIWLFRKYQLFSICANF